MKYCVTGSRCASCSVLRLQATLKHEGILGLYAGYRRKAVQVLVQDLTFYFWLSLLKRTIGRPLTRHAGDAASSIVTAAGAAAINILLTLPMEVVTTRAQTKGQRDSAKTGAVADDSAGHGDSYLAALRRIVKEGGVSSLWRGLVPSLVLTSNPALQFMAYDALLGLARQRFARSHHDANSWQPGATALFVIAALAKAFALLVTYPLIRSKVVMMARRRPGKAAEDAAAPGDTASTLKYTSTLPAVLASIVTTEGPLGLYKGLGAQLTKTVLGSALCMVIRGTVTRHTKAAVAKAASIAIAAQV